MQNIKYKNQNKDPFLIQYYYLHNFSHAFLMWTDSLAKKTKQTKNYDLYLYFHFFSILKIKNKKLQFFSISKLLFFYIFKYFRILLSFEFQTVENSSPEMPTIESSGGTEAILPASISPGDDRQVLQSPVSSSSSM